MCLNVFYFCFCCGTRVVDINIWKCYYKYQDYKFNERKNDPQHMINVKYFESLFEMCEYCQRKCEKNCKDFKFVEKDFDIERIHFVPLSIFKEKKSISRKFKMFCGIQK